MYREKDLNAELVASFRGGLTLPPSRSRRAARGTLMRPTGRPDPSALPSAIASFLEACAEHAARAAVEGDFARARQLIDDIEV
jgi:hypothetical protein